MKFRNKILQLLKPLTLVKGDLTKHMEAMTRIGKTRIATIIGITTCDSFAEKIFKFQYPHFFMFNKDGVLQIKREIGKVLMTGWVVGGNWKSEPIMKRIL